MRAAPRPNGRGRRPRTDGSKLDGPDARPNLHWAGGDDGVRREPLGRAAVAKVAPRDLGERAGRRNAGAHGEVVEPRVKPRAEQRVVRRRASRERREQQLEQLVGHKARRRPPRARVQAERLVQRRVRREAELLHVEAGEAAELCGGGRVADADDAQLDGRVAQVVTHRDEVLGILGAVKLAKLRQHHNEGLAGCGYALE